MEETRTLIGFYRINFYFVFCSFVYFTILRVLFVVCICFIVFGYLFLYILLLYGLVSFYDLILSQIVFQILFSVSLF